MRQVGDTLVWLAMIMVVAAVIYFTPRVAHYVCREGSRAQRRMHDLPRDCLPLRRIIQRVQ